MKLQAKTRKVHGKTPKTLRRQGGIPAILYGGDKEPQPLALSQVEFEKIYHEAGEATIIDLDIDGKKEKVLIAEVQHDPLGKLIHTDLQRVEAGEKLTAAVAIETEGESPIVKRGEGILLTLLDEVEVECLPKDLPSEIKVDISNLSEVGQGIEIKDLPVDQTKVKILGHEPDEPVLKIDYPEMAEEEETPVSEEAAVAAVEAEKEKPKEEGEPGEEEGKKEEKGPPPAKEVKEKKPDEE